MERLDDAFGDLARSGLAIPGVVSVAVFIRPEGSSGLQLAAAAGIEGEPLRRLAAAVADPSHPVARTLHDLAPTFDVLPIAPGGPALRSHVPILVARDGRVTGVGVLAVAHHQVLGASAREALELLAARAGDLAGDPN
jgi:hypothetical protein